MKSVPFSRVHRYFLILKKLVQPAWSNHTILFYLMQSMNWIMRKFEIKIIKFLILLTYHSLQILRSNMILSGRVRCYWSLFFSKDDFFFSRTHVIPNLEFFTLLSKNFNVKQLDMILKNLRRYRSSISIGSPYLVS